MQTSGNSVAATVSFIFVNKLITSDHIGWLDQQISIDQFSLKLTGFFYYSFKNANMEANLFLSILG